MVTEGTTMDRPAHDFRPLVLKPFGHGLTHHYRGPWQARVAMSEPAEHLVEVGKDSAVDLIVMATHGCSGVDRLLHGSVATHVLHHTAPAAVPPAVPPALLQQVQSIRRILLIGA